MGDATSLYRHWGKGGELLYVGISLSAVGRLAQHSKHAQWVQEIANVTIEYFPSREAALDAERIAIKTEKPLWNIIHNKPAPTEKKLKHKRDVPPRLRELEQWLTDLCEQRPSLRASCHSRWTFARTGATQEERDLFAELLLHRVALEIKRKPMPEYVESRACDMDRKYKTKPAYLAEVEWHDKKVSERRKSRKGGVMQETHQAIFG